MSEKGNVNLFESDKSEDYTDMVFSSVGTGRSLLSEKLKEKCKVNKGIYINLEENPSLKGFRPYEYYYARRILESTKGDLPQYVKNKLLNRHVVIVSKTHTDTDEEIDTRSVVRDITLVKTASVEIHRYLLTDARDALIDQAGIALTEKQIIALLEISGLDQVLLDYNQVETTFREKVADALSMDLIGESWPSYADLHDGEGLYNLVFKGDLPFSEKLNNAAKAKGYHVVF